MRPVGQVTLGHSGGMVGMFADAQVDRRRGIGACLLVNGYADDSEANKHVLRVLCDLPSDAADLAASGAARRRK